jgi:putative ABC transport system substrate-binding protein
MASGQLRRREIIAALSGAAVWPLAARAQQPQLMKRIAYVVGIDPGAEGQARLTAFRQGLADLGWIEGRNFEIAVHWDAANPERIKTYVSELVRTTRDVIVSGSADFIAAYSKETRKIPIVFTQLYDPIAQGFAESLSHPGGNVTGFASSESEMATKWLELLREVAPSATKIAILADRQEPSSQIYIRAIEAVGSSHSVTALLVRDDLEIEQAIGGIVRPRNVGLIVLSSPWVRTRRTRFVSP